MASALASELVAELEKLGTADRAVNEKRYLKSPPEFRHFGVTVPSIRKAAKAFARSHTEIDHDALVALVNELWELQIHETCMAAIELLNFNSSDLTEDDAGLIERLIDSSHTWAYVDNLSATTMGSLVTRYPELNAVLDRWSTHTNFWLRRAAMLSLLGPLRAGDGDFKRFTRYAEPMLHEKEFFIRKAIGWILRETSKKRPELIYEWLADHAHEASMLTVREGSKYLPPEQAERVISAAKSGQRVVTG